MNFVGNIGNWGKMVCDNKLSRFSYNLPKANVVRSMDLVSFKESDTEAVSVYSNLALEVTVTRYFNAAGNLCEKYVIKNLREVDYYSSYGNFAIELPFNDRYESADECMTNHCNTHIWCGHTSTYINALKMGASDKNLGLIVTSGSFGSYSVRECKTNVRGIFSLNADHFALLPEEEYVISWEIFCHASTEDFYKKLESYPAYIAIDAEHYTVYENENICFEVSLDDKDAKITLDGKAVPFEYKNGKLLVCHTPTRLGEHCFDIRSGKAKTYAEFFVSEELDTVIKKRVDFIVNNQQCLRKESHLYGAYLIYDNKAESLYYDEQRGDYNACRERVGMGLLIARYLREHPDKKIMESLKRFVDFVKREFYNEETGAVYNTIVGKEKAAVRLYNAPWITTLLTELYYITGDKSELLAILRILKRYYEGGGARFYPNGLSMYDTLKAFEHAGLKEEHDICLAMFKNHANTMLSIGTSYPKHEVDYEQTIVTPAATFISEIGRYVGDSSYIEGAKPHIENLERFGGKQPSFHLYDIPIRYWDGYWFGKKELFGDVFPHYWSILSAHSFTRYFEISNDEKYEIMSNNITRNCLCLFRPDGKASCAYMYPYTCNGVDGEFYDDFANDQDFALYFAMCMQS